MYFSYIPQIMGSLDGNKKPFIQALATELSRTNSKLLILKITDKFAKQPNLSVNKFKLPIS